MMYAFILLVFLMLNFDGGKSSHFRGGTISWRPIQGNTVEFRFKMGCTENKIGQFVNDSFQGDKHWKCSTGCGQSGVEVGSVFYYCSASSPSENWEQGDNVFQYNFTGIGPFDISYTGAMWMPLNYGSPNGWVLQTTVDLRIRDDINTINFSPITASKPTYTLQFACYTELQLPMFDPDGDSVKCRWAHGKECDSVCNAVPSAVLDEFLLHLVVLNTPCDWKPEFVSPTPLEGSVISIPAGKSFNSNFYAANPKNSNERHQSKTRCMTLIAWDLPDPCIHAQCPGNHTCSRLGSSQKFECLCPAGYNSSGLWCIIDINECLSTPCQNGGTCTNTLVGFNCDCQQGFTGQICETDIDECLSNPCENGGTCDDYANGYDCYCTSGYTGWECESEIDECSSNPCQHGNCFDEIDGYDCDCDFGYTGRDCETDIDECSSNPCKHNGTCIDEVDGFHCLCTTGYTGQMCEEIDECSSSPCQHSGKCIDRVNAFSCLCASGYTGKKCETDIDECLSSPCQHEGTCRDEVNGFYCSCAKGYIGQKCEVFDQCSSYPCQNGGRCRNRVNDFVCLCALGYTGKKCEKGIEKTSTHSHDSCFTSKTVILLILFLLILILALVVAVGTLTYTIVKTRKKIKALKEKMKTADKPSDIFDTDK